MIQVKVNGNLYEATVDGRINDREWNNRESKTITLSNLSYTEVCNLFPNNVSWSIVQTDPIPQTDSQGNIILNDSGEPTYTEVTTEFDNSEYSISGNVIDHRDGMISIKMGKPTQLEIAQQQLASGGTTQEYEDAYIEGVNSL